MYFINDSVEKYKQGWVNFLNQEHSTRDLQLASLEVFLDVLGYGFVCSSKDGTWHIKKKKGNKIKYFPDFLSIQQAVRLHNGVYRVSGLQCVFPFIQIPAELYLEARNTRMVEQVYLQRKKGEWLVQKNMVRFT